MTRAYLIFKKLPVIKSGYRLMHTGDKSVLLYILTSIHCAQDSDFGHCHRCTKVERFNMHFPNRSPMGACFYMLIFYLFLTEVPFKSFGSFLNQAFRFFFFFYVVFTCYLIPTWSDKSFANTFQSLFLVFLVS